MSKVLIIPIAIMLIVVGCSYRSEQYAGSVNGNLITNQQYIGAWRNEFESYRLRHGFNPSQTEMEELRESAWRKLVESIIIQEELNKRGITVTRQEAIDSLTTSIPDFIKSNEVFYHDDIFDMESYRQSLLTGTPIDLSWLVNHYIRAYIPVKKLEKELINDYRFSERELRREYSIRFSKVDIDVIIIDSGSFPATVSEIEIQQYYNNHLSDFLIEPSAVMSYVVFGLEPSRSDSLKAEAKINDIYDSLENGEDFLTLVSRHSQGRSASKRRGETDFIELNTLPDMLQRELDSVEGVGYTKPYFINGRWIIYQPITRTRNLIKFREIVVYPSVSEQTEENLLDYIIHFRELAREIGLERAAYEYDMELHETDNLSLTNSYIPGLGRSDRIVERAIEANPGTIFEPILHNSIPLLGGKKGFVLINVKDSQKLNYKPLNDVRDEIEKVLKEEKQLASAFSYASELVDKNSYSNLKVLLKNIEHLTVSYQNFSYDSTVKGEYHEDFNRDILSSEKSRIVTRPYTAGDKVFIGLIGKFYKAPVSDYVKYKDVIQVHLKSNLEDEYFQDWLSAQISRARIRDWRR